MKKIFISVALMLALTCGAKAQTTTIRQNIDQPVTELNIKGKSIVKVFKDQDNHVDIVVKGTGINVDSLASLLPKNLITFVDSVLTIDDKEGINEFHLHLNPESLRQYRKSLNATLGISATDFDKAEEVYSEEHWVKDGLAYTVINGDTTITEYTEPRIEIVYDNPTDNMVDRLENFEKLLDRDDASVGIVIDTLINIWKDFGKEITITKENGKSDDNKKAKKHYGNGRRTDFDFLWGFTNWGDSPITGLMKMPGAYNLKTSFSSYQLGWNYAFVMTPHWQVKLGVNYESDVYKFTNDYVDLTTNGIEVIPEASQPVSGDWSSKMVTRYVSLPITVGYRSNDKPHHFRVDLAAVPGLCFNTRHTGIKHKVDAYSGDNFKSVSDISSVLNPYKLDVRFDISARNLKLFVQVPTLPLFNDPSMPKIYPIKLGFML